MDPTNDKFSSLEPAAQLELIKRLTALQRATGGLWDLWGKHDEYNDKIDISKLIPMSMDEWTMAIGSRIESYADAMVKIPIKCEGCGTHNVVLGFVDTAKLLKSGSYYIPDINKDLAPNHKYIYCFCNTCGTEMFMLFLPGMVLPNGNLIMDEGGE